MNKIFYPKLALQNIGKNARNYISYMITCVITIAMFYIMSALTCSAQLDHYYGMNEVRIFLGYGQWIIGIFAFIFLFYTHSFIIKRRKKEFGLYNILGMEKRHIAVVLLYETLYCALISLILGLIFGIILYQAAQLLLIKLVQTQAALSLPFSGQAIILTLILFGIIFFLTYLSTLRQIQVSSPIELLRGSQAGEKEPKARIILVILGVLCLGGGYYISITATSPLETVGLFFLAVIMVIVGTYCLFTSITIAVLKLLRKSKAYYYKPNHFTFVSGMLYRMKQNAVGLANICVLSTMVLVMMSTSLMLYVSIDDQVHTSYPRDIELDIYRPEPEKIPEIKDYVNAVLEQNQVTPQNVQCFYETGLVLVQDGSRFYYSDNSSVYTDTNIAVVNLMTLDDFNRLAGTGYTLDNAEDVYIYAYSGSIDSTDITIEDMTFHIKGFTEAVDIADGPSKNLSDTFYMIVKDMDAINTIMDALFAEYMYSPVPVLFYMFDVDGDSQLQLDVQKILLDAVFEDGNAPVEIQGSISSSAEAASSYYTLYGGLLFIGIFLGILFMMATVLIIYYKQITEGYEDQFRFEIMQNVGMSRREVKGTIRTQVLSVFYLPLGMACVHTAFAFPIIARLLTLLNMTNTTLLLWGMAITIIIFTIFYTIIYALTAQLYYKIVSVKNRE